MGGKRRLPALAMTVLLSAGLGTSATTAQEVPPTPEELFAIARQYLIDNAAAYGVTPADVADLVVTSQYQSTHNGVTHVNVQQRRAGVPVNNGHGTVNLLTETGDVVYVGESFIANLNPAPSGEVELGATEAVEAAADELDLGEPSDLEVISREPGATRETVVSDGGISDEPIPTSLGWQPTGKGLRLAWQVTIDSSSEDQLLNAIVDSETG